MTTTYGGDHPDFGGGTFNDSVIGKVEGGLHQHHYHHGPVPVATSSLPAPPAGFTGRDGDLARLLPVLDPTGADTGLPVVICAVSGLGGIGKTSLALYAAQHADIEGWFPGGTLFVDLRGYDDNPVTADQAVLALLDALGVRGALLPQTTAAQYALYRTLLAQERQPLLLLLDNASDATQITALLPGVGAGQHRVLITSRDRLTALPARLIDLDTLSAEAAAELLALALRLSDDRDDRPAREPGALAELAAVCGHHPLALQIAASMLRKRRHRSIASLVADIRAAADPTDVLALRPVFDVSYDRLPRPQARLLRLLSLAPTAEVGTDAAAALADLSSAQALWLLDELASAHFVTPVQEQAGELRWRLHDLVRAYGARLGAGDKWATEEAEAARARLLDYYRDWTVVADDHLQRMLGDPDPGLFEGRTQALDWLDAERANLVAAAQWAGHDRHAPTAISLALNLWGYLDWRRHFEDMMTVGWCAQRAAERTENDADLAGAWNLVGIALREQGRIEEAVDAGKLAAELYEAVDDPRGAAAAWDNLGNALGGAGRQQEAIEAHTHAGDLFRSEGQVRGEATSWNNLGIALGKAGRNADAVEAHTNALHLYQQVGDLGGESRAWHNLGGELRTAGRVEEAIDAYVKAVAMCMDIGDWYGAGLGYHELAAAHEIADQPDSARTALLRSADAYDRANAPTEAANSRSRAAQ
ncbi:tetratricopeptide repeat protein [Streptomyces sp. NPDC050658]|uniref:tetratricopeptide repeat protein n=1 Tax=unclassified Streptomyces TaxID=2593676 RepID=UPI0034341BF5